MANKNSNPHGMRAKSNRSERSEQRSAVRTKTYKLQVSDWLLPVDVFLQREIKILQVKERIWSDHVNHQYLCENFQKPPVFKRKVSQRPWDLIANRGSQTQTSETLFAPVNRLLNGYTDSGTLVIFNCEVYVNAIQSRYNGGTSNPPLKVQWPF